MAAVQLSGDKAAGRVALVDDDDLHLVSGHHWHIYEVIRPGGSVDGPYAITHVYRDGRRTTVRMHQLITGWIQTDHLDGNGLDNRRHNLRPATDQQNMWNQGPALGSTSRFKGVAWHKRHGRWIAYIRVSGRIKHLGYFTDETEAAMRYDQEASRVHGEYARLNIR